MWGWLRDETALASRSKRARNCSLSARLRRQDLERDVAIEPRVLRAVDLAHAPGADGGENFVGPEARGGCQGQKDSLAVSR